MRNKFDKGDRVTVEFEVMDVLCKESGVDYLYSLRIGPAWKEKVYVDGEFLDEAAKHKNR